MELRRAESDGEVARARDLAGSVLQRRAGDLRVGRRPARRARRAGGFGRRRRLRPLPARAAAARRRRHRRRSPTAAGRATAVAMVAYDSSGGRDFFFSVRGSAAEAIDVAAAERAAREASWIHVSGSSIGFGDRSPRPSSATVAAGLRAGARLSLDPNLRPDSPPEARERTARLARRASLVFPSPGELDGARALDARARRPRARSCARPMEPAGAEIHAPDGDGPSRSPHPPCARSTRPARATRSRPPSSRRTRAAPSPSAPRRPPVRWRPTA